MDHYRAALAVRRASYHPSHPLVLGNLSQIGRCLTELARHDEAEVTLLEVFDVLEPLKDQQDRLWDSTLIRLERLYRAMGDEGEAARFEAMRTRPVS